MSRSIEIIRESLILKPIAFEQFVTSQSKPQKAQREETQAKVSQILENASLEAENLKRSAYEEGYKAGFAQGHEEGRNEFLKAAEKLEKLLGEFSMTVSEAKREFFESIERELVELVIALVEKVAYKEIANGETIQNIVKRAIQLVGEEKKIVIRLHPDDLDLLKENGFERESHLDLIPDKDIESGGCFIEADKKIVDARLETRLEEMIEVLYGKS